MLISVGVCYLFRINKYRWWWIAFFFINIFLFYSKETKKTQQNHKYNIWWRNNNVAVKRFWNIYQYFFIWYSDLRHQMQWKSIVVVNWNSNTKLTFTIYIIVNLFLLEPFMHSLIFSTLFQGKTLLRACFKKISSVLCTRFTFYFLKMLRQYLETFIIGHTFSSMWNILNKNPFKKHGNISWHIVVYGQHLWLHPYPSDGLPMYICIRLQ